MGLLSKIFGSAEPVVQKVLPKHRAPTLYNDLGLDDFATQKQLDAEISKIETIASDRESFDQGRYLQRLPAARVAHDVLSNPQTRAQYDEFLRLADESGILRTDCDPAFMHKVLSRLRIIAEPDLTEAGLYHLRHPHDPGKFDIERPPRQDARRAPKPSGGRSFDGEVNDFDGLLTNLTSWHWWHISPSLADPLYQWAPQNTGPHLAARFYVTHRVASSGSVHEVMGCGVRMLYVGNCADRIAKPRFVVGGNPPVKYVAKSLRHPPRPLSYEDWTGEESWFDVELTKKDLLILDSGQRVQVEVEAVRTVVPPAALAELNELIRYSGVVND